jgi:hypothetical protein
MYKSSRAESMTTARVATTILRLLHVFVYRSGDPRGRHVAANTCSLGLPPVAMKGVFTLLALITRIKWAEEYGWLEFNESGWRGVQA